MGRLIVCCLIALTASNSIQSSRAADRPNVVWLLSEDNSIHYLDIYRQPGAKTPAIAGMARHGLQFQHAFSNSPVCSVARTTVMSGCYAPRVGTQFHRKIEMAQWPGGQKLFPAYLRSAGYYCSNNVKTDYNVKTNKDVWDQSSRKANWRNRPKPSTPFFHMESNGASHESSLHFTRQQMQADLAVMDNGDVEVAPYHPDTKIVRYTNARYHERIRRIDQWVDSILKRLEEDGVLEDTFVFYFGDHGGVLPRSKGYLYETGLHVPLVVRVPKNFRHLVSWEMGQQPRGFVSFVDFGPTVISLAGVPVPVRMDGRPFLGADTKASEVDQRDESFGYADRFDEKYELVRSLRRGPWKYMRNFQGYYPDGLQNNYRYRQLAFREWRERYMARELNAVQSQFFERKPAELLFNVSDDPFETRNLAADPKYADVLVKLRERLETRMAEMPDLSLYPESVLVDQALRNPLTFGMQHQAEIKQLLTTANLGVLPIDDAQTKIRSAMKSKNRWVRYWAATNCGVYGEQARGLVPDLKELLQDEELLVRVRAAECLGDLKAIDPVPVLKQVLRESKSPVVNLITLNGVVYLQDGPHHYEFGITADDIPVQNGEVRRRIEYLTEE